MYHLPRDLDKLKSFKPSQGDCLSAQYLTCYALNRELEFQQKRQALFGEAKQFPPLELEQEFARYCFSQPNMTTDDIGRLLDFMGVQVKQHHVDAFLRRCDRDQDFKLDFEEWLATIGRSRADIDAEIKRLEDERKAEEKRIEDEKKAEKKKKEDEEAAELKKIEDKIQADKAKREAEIAKIEQERAEKAQRNSSCAWTAIKFMQGHMDDLDELERELKRLTYLKTFHVLDAFRAADRDSKGYLTPQDIYHFFGYVGYTSLYHHGQYNGSVHLYGYQCEQELIDFWSNWHDREGRLTFEDWNQVLMGHSIPDNFKAPDGYTLQERKRKVNAIR